ncbi:hypothetical protein RchiOBHm_Chr4g0398991 [Rosa chinensis]|uniref:Uncharacterized protein n=1 Tax=Rosa chinensis TaxID=74649 RepID=A0A2P6QSG4_ROSCH|nr:hypothetical protein RchiOBHm_Chr4g0398991 [Rosa chinensis]
MSLTSTDAFVVTRHASLLSLAGPYWCQRKPWWNRLIGLCWLFTKLVEMVAGDARMVAMRDYLIRSCCQTLSGIDDGEARASNHNGDQVDHRSAHLA